MAISPIDSSAASVTLSTPPRRQPSPQAASAGDASAAPLTSGLENRSGLPDVNQPMLEDVKSAVEKVQRFVKTSSSEIQFSIDDTSGSTVIKVIDPSTKDIIRQIPSKEMLEIAQALDRLQGLLVKQQA